MISGPPEQGEIPERRKLEVLREDQAGDHPWKQLPLILLILSPARSYVIRSARPPVSQISHCRDCMHPMVEARPLPFLPNPRFLTPLVASHTVCTVDKQHRIALLILAAPCLIMLLPPLHCAVESGHGVSTPCRLHCRSHRFITTVDYSPPSPCLVAPNAFTMSGSLARWSVVWSVWILPSISLSVPDHVLLRLVCAVA